MTETEHISTPSPHPIFLNRTSSITRVFSAGRVVKRLESLGYPSDLAAKAAHDAKNDGRLASELAHHRYWSHTEAEEPDTCPECQREDQRKFKQEVAGMMSPRL